MKKYVAAILVLACGPAAAQTAYNQCIAEILTNEKFFPLAQKVSLGVVKNQSFEMLANNSYPTAEEKKLLAEWAEHRDTCFKASEGEIIQNTPSAIGVTLMKINSEFLALVADLYNAQLTYGQFAKERAAKNHASQASLRAISNQYNRQAEALAQQRRGEDDAHRNAALQMLMNRPQIQPYQMQPYQMPIPTPSIQTNCTRLGNQTNCTTR